ncbi:hypothetical protein NPIL_369451 [Nephila pilipes]|uniref:Uncharacterized protein n=1 Tax=Nephila pilipes TaxID=299642 RepID=A0A8X6JWT3_NEPPI|nr:hypothetical protein NPIL_369451 [Nephila pilipes]
MLSVLLQEPVISVASSPIVIRCKTLRVRFRYGWFKTNPIWIHVLQIAVSTEVTDFLFAARAGPPLKTFRLPLPLVSPPLNLDSTGSC